jgi:hypothetical protein
MRDVGDELVLADTRLEVLGDVLVGAIDHGAGRIKQDDLVDRFDLARVEHDLLRVPDGQPFRLECGDHGWLDDVDAERHVGGPFRPQDPGDLLCGLAEQPGIRGDGAAESDHPGMDVLGPQPRAVRPVVLGGRAEIPDVRVPAT